MSRASIENLIALLERGKVSRDELILNINKIKFKSVSPEPVNIHTKESDSKEAFKECRKIVRRAYSLQGIFKRPLTVTLDRSLKCLGQVLKHNKISSLCGKKLDESLILEHSSEHSNSNCESAVCSSPAFKSANTGRNTYNHTSKTDCSKVEVKPKEHRVDCKNGNKSKVARMERIPKHPYPLVNDKFYIHNKKLKVTESKNEFNLKSKPRILASTELQSKGKKKVSYKEVIPVRTSITSKQIKLKYIIDRKYTLTTCKPTSNKGTSCSNRFINSQAFLCENLSNKTKSIELDGTSYNQSISHVQNKHRNLMNMMMTSKNNEY